MSPASRYLGGTAAPGPNFGYRDNVSMPSYFGNATAAAAAFPRLPRLRSQLRLAVPVASLRLGGGVSLNIKGYKMTIAHTSVFLPANVAKKVEI